MVHTKKITRGIQGKPLAEINASVEKNYHAVIID